MYVHVLYNSLTTVDWCDVGRRVTIDMLPDVALLEIFDFYVHELPLISAWQALVHVCRNWRNIVFGSPCRLDMQLLCKASTPVRETLDVWPPLPIIAYDQGAAWSVDNVIALLERSDRICDLALTQLSSSLLEIILKAMQQPFPVLTRLKLQYHQFLDETAPVVPASFLDGSAPRLQELTLVSIPFPGLPNLLLSATHLITLELWDICHSGYFTPESMVTALSVLTRLETLDIRFKCPRCRPDRKRRRPPPQTRTPLPALALIKFKGVSEYLEDILAWIDAPMLFKMDITFFHQLIFDIPRSTMFISHTFGSEAYCRAHVTFSDCDVSVEFPSEFPSHAHGGLYLRVSCSQPDWQLSSVTQVCSSSFHPTLIPAVEHLYIRKRHYSELHWEDNAEGGQWLELLHLFTAVKELRISWQFTSSIAHALKELVGESVIEVLPALETLIFEEPLSSASGHDKGIIGQFVAARRLAGHYIALDIPY